MKTLLDLGLIQGVLPPQERPHIPALRHFGYSGTDAKILEAVAKKNPELLIAVSSASCMWVANAATVSPSSDTKTKTVHFTPANLVSKFHRSLESQTTSRILKKIFKNSKYFTHHESLKGGGTFGDEGAANHTRLCTSYEKKGLEFFVFGKFGLKSDLEPKRFPARQTFEASQAVARLHQLNESHCFFAQQNPQAIDAGVFHNDVAGVGNQNVYFYHEDAFAKPIENELQEKFQNVCNQELILIKVPKKDVSLQDAVKSYLFNSQLLTLKKNHMLLLAPRESQETTAVKSYINSLLESGTPIKEVRYLDLRQSMQNGGGPACLRLRVVLNTEQLQATHKKVILTEALYLRLVKWIKKHYRDTLSLDDLRDPHLLKESRAALDELTQVLSLGSIYDFQL
jgi:succinylarginine dihydrolase